VLIGSNYSVTGLALFHMNVSLGGLIQNSGATAVTLSGTLPFTTFANAGQSASITVPGVTYSVSGSVTGVRYSATLNGTIFTNGGGASYFPGGAAGSTSTGGQYA
jgi:hypothetical protein